MEKIQFRNPLDLHGINHQVLLSFHNLLRLDLSPDSESLFVSWLFSRDLLSAHRFKFEKKIYVIDKILVAVSAIAAIATLISLQVPFRLEFQDKNYMLGTLISLNLQRYLVRNFNSGDLQLFVHSLFLDHRYSKKQALGLLLLPFNLSISNTHLPSSPIPLACMKILND